MWTTLLALSLLPRVDAGAEVAHDLGLSSHLRGTIELSLDLALLTSPDFELSLWTQTRTYVRENQSDESPVRISPRQIHYPVGAALTFPLGDSGWRLGPFAAHQSNHDIDTTDAVENRETLSFEQYGVRLEGPAVELSGAVYYDRGTRLSGRSQRWPFESYLGGLKAEGEWALPWGLYTGGELNLLFHRDEDHTPKWFDLSGRLDLGCVIPGERGRARGFLRFERLEGYRHIGDGPHDLLLLGTALETR